MGEKPALSLAERIIRWTAGMGAAMVIVPAVWASANCFAHNDHEEMYRGALICSDVDGFFSYTIVHQDFMYMSVTRTHDYFFLKTEMFYADNDGDYLVDTIERRTSMVFGEPRVIRYEVNRDLETHPAEFLEADLEFMRQARRFMFN